MNDTAKALANENRVEAYEEFADNINDLMIEVEGGDMPRADAYEAIMDAARNLKYAIHLIDLEEEERYDRI